jgi:hypothetical protein
LLSLVKSLWLKSRFAGMFRNGTKSFSRGFISSDRVSFIWLRPLRQSGINAHTDSNAYRDTHSNPDACFNSDRPSDNDAFPDTDALSDTFSHAYPKSLRQRESYRESQLDSNTCSAPSPPSSPPSRQAHGVITMDQTPDRAA